MFAGRGVGFLKGGCPGRIGLHVRARVGSSQGGVVHRGQFRIDATVVSKRHVVWRENGRKGGRLGGRTGMLRRADGNASWFRMFGRFAYAERIEISFRCCTTIFHFFFFFVCVWGLDFICDIYRFYHAYIHKVQ